MDGRVKTLHPRSTAACWAGAASTMPHGRSTTSRHRPPGGEPLSLRGDRRQARLHLRRRDREHRHRRPRDGARRGEESRVRRRHRRSGRLRARARRSRGQRRRHQHRHARSARRQGVRAHRACTTPWCHRTCSAPRGQGRGVLPATLPLVFEKAAGPALRRESAPAAPRSTASSAPRGVLRRDAPACSRARSCRSTTSPTPTPRWNACACSTSRPA